jgi:hypothetical protein
MCGGREDVVVKIVEVEKRGSDLSNEEQRSVYFNNAQGKF